METGEGASVPERHRRPLAKRVVAKASDVRRQTFELGGQVIGRYIAKPVVEARKQKVEQFDFTIAGSEHLEGLDGSYILAANHLMPQGVVDQTSGFSPDAFAILSAVRQTTNREPIVIGKSDDGWWGRFGYQHFQKYVTRPVMHGIVRGLGNIPVWKNPGSTNSDFFKLVRQTASQGEILLTFPQGNWADDYDPDMPFADGTSYMALANRIPVVPVYISGAHTWDKGQRVSVSFAEPIHVVPGQTNTREARGNLTERIKLSIGEARNQIQAIQQPQA